MPKRKRVIKAVKAKSNKNLFIASAVIILIVLFAVVMLMPNEPGVANTTPAQEEKQSTVISSGDVCTDNIQCFAASCKSTPSVWECVNVTGQELYYKNCNVYSNVNVVQDPSRCACVQGRCTAVR